MTALRFRPADACRFDAVALGEVMLRLDPGEGRVRTSRSFQVWEGGGEYNVVRALRRCFHLQTAIVTSLADNDVGRLVEDLVLQGGVDTSWLRWVPYDGIGRSVRNGLNFTERGFGVRGAIGTSDRGNTAASQITPGTIDWDRLFGDHGARWFHTGGIFAGLSASTAAVAEEAMVAARRHGTVVSYDLNYRPSIWKAIGGLDAARAVNTRLAPHVDVMLGNEEDFTACLGFQVTGVGEGLDELPAEGFRQMIGQVANAYPTMSVAATTLRTVLSANVNDWGAVAWDRDDGFAEAIHRSRLAVLDRVGGGDSFASGLIYGLLTTGDIGRAVEYGAAHGALAMTTPGDTSMASLAEVEALAGRERTRPTMTIVDTHVHVWDLVKASYPWLTADLSVLARDYGLDDTRAARQRCGVGRVVLVQAADNLEDSANMFAPARHGEVAGVVAWVPLTDPKTTEEALDRWAAAGPLVGVRHLVHREPDPDWLLRPTVLASLGVVAERELVFEVCAENTPLLAHVPTVANRHPGLRLVIDHLAKPPIRNRGWQPWATLMERAAETPNVFAKISGLNTAAVHDRWTSADFQPYVDHAVASFGAERLMIGSDWPFAHLAAANYQEVWTATAATLDHLEPDDRAAVKERTPALVYRLPRDEPGDEPRPSA